MAGKIWNRRGKFGTDEVPWAWGSVSAVVAKVMCSRNKELLNFHSKHGDIAGLVSIVCAAPVTGGDIKAQNS